MATAEVIAREDAARLATMKTEQRRAAYMRRVLMGAAQDINARIAAFWMKYASDEGLSLAEARKKVDAHDVRAFEAEAARIVREKDFSAAASAAMKLYNTTMKINRLEMLKAEVGLVLVRSYADLEERFDKDLFETAKDEAERQAGILGGSALGLTDTIAKAVSRPFRGVIYNERLWNNETLLQADIGGILTSGFIQGRHPRELARVLRRRVTMSAEDAEILMITEMSRVQTAAQMATFEAFGYEKYEFIPERDAKVCPTCHSMDGKVYRVADAEPGRNCPPMHPRCRCSTAAVMGSRKPGAETPGQKGITGKARARIAEKGSAV